VKKGALFAAELFSGWSYALLS